MRAALEELELATAELAALIPARLSECAPALNRRQTAVETIARQVAAGVVDRRLHGRLAAALTAGAALVRRLELHQHRLAVEFNNCARHKRLLDTLPSPDDELVRLWGDW